MTRRRLDPTYLLDHLDYVAHLGPLIRGGRCTRHGNLQQPHHLLLDIFVPHQLQIENLSRPFLSHHGLNPPRKVYDPTTVTAPGPNAVHHGRAFPREQLQEKDTKGVHVGFLGEFPTVH